MLLEDATSKIQVQRALEAGDEELREDIEEKLNEAMHWWDTRGLTDYFHQDEDTESFRDIATWPAFIDKVIEESPSAYDLGHIPREDVEAALRWAATHPSGRHQEKYGPFYIDSSGDSFSFRVSTNASAHFPEEHLPDNAEYIPVEQAREFWESLDGHVQWDQVDRVEENDGHLDGDPFYVAASSEEFDEWCRDLLAEHVQSLIRSDPAEAKEIFLKGVDYENAPLGAKLRAAGLPDEELLDFASKWFEGESEREEILATLKDHFAALETGTDEPREIIAEWTQADLRAMGIMKGPLYEEAPWKLIKLHPSDLRLEGTLMRHCVGDKGMGYIRALTDGEIEVWSLRSRANKPRFTLEIDSSHGGFPAGCDTAPDPAACRADAIKQLKGKANRTPGYAGHHDTTIKFPDEVVFWDHVLRSFQVDPGAVEDMGAWRTLDNDDDLPIVTERLRRLVQPNASVCTGFDLPYRPRRDVR